MEYSILIEKIDDGSLPEGYYYAHIPALDLTTQGFGSPPVLNLTFYCINLITLFNNKPD